MRLLILSRSEQIGSTRRLQEAGVARGHQVSVLNPADMELDLGRRGAQLRMGLRRLPPFDAVIPRIAPSLSAHGLGVLEQLAVMGVPSVNSATAIAKSRNSLRCLQALLARGVPVPETVMRRASADLRQVVLGLGGLPVLIKLVRGQERHGVMVCETAGSLSAAMDAMLGLKQDVVVQEYVRTELGDIRVMVVGQRAVAAVRRRVREGRMSKTLRHRAEQEPLAMKPWMKAHAEAAAKAVGLQVCAVDMLENRGRAKVFEVNSSPAIAELEAVLGCDIASSVIQCAERLVAKAQKTRHN